MVELNELYDSVKRANISSGYPTSPHNLIIEGEEVKKYFLFKRFISSLGRINVWLGLCENDIAVFSSQDNDDEKKINKAISFYTYTEHNDVFTFLERSPHTTKEKKFIDDPSIIAQTEIRSILLKALNDHRF